MATGISKTLVLPAIDALSNGMLPICSFYTIAPTSIERKTLPKTLSKKLPHYPVPAFLLAQLAVDVASPSVSASVPSFSSSPDTADTVSSNVSAREPPI